MNNIAVILALVIILVLVWPKAVKGTPPSALVSTVDSCPPGFYNPEIPTTWGGWVFNCRPAGHAASTSDFPQDMKRWAYGPIIEGTGEWEVQGEPAKYLQD